MHDAATAVRDSRPHPRPLTTLPPSHVSASEQKEKSLTTLLTTFGKFQKIPKIISA